MKRRKFLLAAVTLVLLLGIVAALHQSWLTWLGGALVDSRTPERADVALVLAGDHRGSRIRFAGNLVREGFVPKVLVSGPMTIYGENEADLAISFAVKQGFPPEVFEPLYIQAFSTQDEAKAYGDILSRRGVRRVLLVTSNFHTARAGKIFRESFPETIRLVTVAAPDQFFEPGTWWHTREGRKTFFFEASKTVAERIGL